MKWMILQKSAIRCVISKWWKMLSRLPLVIKLIEVTFFQLLNSKGQQNLKKLLTETLKNVCSVGVKPKIRKRGKPMILIFSNVLHLYKSPTDDGVDFKNRRVEKGAPRQILTMC